MTEDRRVDTLTGDVVQVVAARQDRPNLPPTDDCPFCVGGIEAPVPYEAKVFPNRWPPLPDDRCEIVLYTPVHDATFAELGRDGARRVVDLWAQRTAALGARPDVDYVLDTTPDYRLKREHLSLETPDGKTLPLPTVEESRSASDPRGLS